MFNQKSKSTIWQLLRIDIEHFWKLIDILYYIVIFIHTETTVWLSKDKKNSCRNTKSHQATKEEYKDDKSFVFSLRLIICIFDMSAGKELFQIFAFVGKQFIRTGIHLKYKCQMQFSRYQKKNPKTTKNTCTCRNKISIFYSNMK